MRSDVEQILLYLIVLKTAIGVVAFYVATKKAILDIRTFIVIAFVPWLSVIYVMIKRERSGDGVSAGLWIYLSVTVVEVVAVSALRTIPIAGE
jgi:hypothetical protein